MTTTNESKVNLILDKPSNWIQWFFIIQNTAKTNKVWEYVDLAIKKDNILVLELPKWPIPKDVLSTATLISKLDQHQLTAYNQLYTKYKDNLHIYQKKEQAINNISNYIICMISVAYLPLINGLDMVYKRLQVFKKALTPITLGQKHDILN